MTAIARYIKEHEAPCKVVFIGPCTAKKMEVQREDVKPYVDAAMTFEELQALFDSRDIDITTLDEGVLDNASYFGRIFARCGGLSDAVAEGLKEQNIDFTVKPCACDGIEACKLTLLRKARTGWTPTSLKAWLVSAAVSAVRAARPTAKKNKAEVDKYGREAFEKTISDAVSVLKH